MITKLFYRITIVFCLTIFLNQNVKAQYVSIPDPNFLTFLQQLIPGCFNGNMLDTTCSSLMSVYSLDVSPSVTNLDGVQYFDNLNTLIEWDFMPNANVFYVPAFPPNLQNLALQGSFTSLPPIPPYVYSLSLQGNLSSMPPLPNYLYSFSFTNASAMPLPTLPVGLNTLWWEANTWDTLPSLPAGLQNLYCRSNQLTQLPTLPASLKTLDCSSNLLTNLNTLSDSILTLDCSHNLINSLPSVYPNSLIDIDCSYNSLTSITSLPQSLQTLTCTNNSCLFLSTLPSTTITLDCSNNHLTALPALATGIKTLTCSNNPLGVLPALPSTLQNLTCAYNGLLYLPALPSSLLQLACNNNQIQQLPTLPSGLQGLGCGSNLIDTLPALPASLSTLTCNDNNLDSLPPLPSSLTYLNCSNNTITSLPVMSANLKQVYANYNQLTSLPDLPHTMSTLSISYNYNLHCLPRIDTINYFAWQSTGIACLPDYGVIYNSNPLVANTPLCDMFNTNGCDFFWNISGSVYDDVNNNCVDDVNEPKFKNTKIDLYKNGNLIQSTYCNKDGLYNFKTDTGTYIYTVDTANSVMKVKCPVVGFLQSTLTNTDSTDAGKSFAIKCKTGYDVGVNSIVNALGAFRPATYVKVKVEAGAIGNLSGLNCNGGVSGYVKIVSTGASHFYAADTNALIPQVFGDTLLYTIADFSLVNFSNDFIFYMLTDTTAPLNSQVCFDIEVNPIINDFNPTNNALQYCFDVVNSYDPNLKSVYPSSRVDDVNNEIIYTIQFQNTGNAPAIHIYVMDTLDMALNPATFKLLTYSVEPQVQLIGNILRFNFPNINLPDSTHNEPQSHGYVQFSIKLYDSIPLGYELSNTSFIYFDFNTPVQTNVVSDTITDCDNFVSDISIGNTTFCKSDSLLASINLSTPATSIEWYLDNVLIGDSLQIAIPNLSIGVYQLKVVATNTYCVTEKVTYVTYYDLPNINLGVDTSVCDGTAIHAGSGFANYLWSNSSTKEFIAITTAGNYTITVTDINGCKNKDVIMINQVYANPAFSLGSDTSICVFPMTLNANILNLNYLWSNGVTTQTNIINAPGNYFVVVTDSFGCHSSDMITVNQLTVPPQPIVTNIGHVLYSSSSSGNQWYFNGNIISNATSATYTANQTGWYGVVVTNNFGCTNESVPVYLNFTGLAEANASNGIIISPNPADDFLSIQWNSSITILRIQICDALGRNLFVQEIKDQPDQNLMLDIKQLPAGVCLIKVETTNGLLIQKVIKL